MNQIVEGKNSVDSRKARRFELRVPVIFQWLNEENVRCNGTGFARDISIAGIFVIARSAVPPLASEVELQVLLPPLHHSAPVLQLCSRGTVVRVETSAEGNGFGSSSYFGRLDQDQPDSPLQQCNS